MTTSGNGHAPKLNLTKDQQFIVARLLWGERKGEVLEYLHKHYGIRLTQEIHDSATLCVPTSVTATDASVIVTELQALFG